jgi:hypothetical protein
LTANVPFEDDGVGMTIGTVVMICGAVHLLEIQGTVTVVNMVVHSLFITVSSGDDGLASTGVAVSRSEARVTGTVVTRYDLPEHLAAL